MGSKTAIIDALKCCNEDKCRDCPYRHFEDESGVCLNELHKDILELIIEQEKEITVYKDEYEEFAEWVRKIKKMLSIKDTTSYKVESSVIKRDWP